MAKRNKTAKQTKSRSLRIPLELDESISKAADMGGRSFSDVVIQLLEGKEVIVVEEGAKIAQLLMKLHSYLAEQTHEESDQIHDVLEQITIVLHDLIKKYILDGGE